jgi:elongation factor 2
VAALDAGSIRDGAPKGQVAIKAMIEAGLDRPTAKNVVYVSNNCILVDASHGVQYLNEVMELLIDGFHRGSKGRASCKGKVLRSNGKDNGCNNPRGPSAQRTSPDNPCNEKGNVCRNATAGVHLVEPKQMFTINVPQEYMSDVITFLQSKRGQVQGIEQDREQMSIKAKLPVSEVIKGFSNSLRSQPREGQSGTTSLQDTKSFQQNCKTR